MDRINRWKLADELNIYQIALLIAGYDPAEFESSYYEKWPESVKEKTSPFLIAVRNAANTNKVIFRVNTDSDGDTDWYRSTINIDSLVQWMQSRNFSDGFFISNTNSTGSISDRSGEFYAPKLAAAVRAWNEVTSDPGALRGKPPKKALEIWLRKHANEYGLTGKDGNPNKLGIEEICKVANWKPSGGASPTPAPENPPGFFGGTLGGFGPNSGRVALKPPTPSPISDLDDDIPF